MHSHKLLGSPKSIWYTYPTCYHRALMGSTSIGQCTASPKVGSKSWLHCRTNWKHPTEQCQTSDYARLVDTVPHGWTPLVDILQSTFMVLLMLTMVALVIWLYHANWLTTVKHVLFCIIFIRLILSVAPCGTLIKVIRPYMCIIYVLLPTVKLVGSGSCYSFATCAFRN